MRLLERVAITWLVTDLAMIDRAVRFDYLKMLVINERSAMIRRHIGCMTCELA